MFFEVRFYFYYFHESTQSFYLMQWKKRRTSSRFVSLALTARFVPLPVCCQVYLLALALTSIIILRRAVYGEVRSYVYRRHATIKEDYAVAAAPHFISVRSLFRSFIYTCHAMVKGIIS